MGFLQGWSRLDLLRFEGFKDACFFGVAKMLAFGCCCYFFGFVEFGRMDLEVSTPALLFPAISLLFLSFTNRFLHLAALIRRLHDDWVKDHEALVYRQISNLAKRLVLIRTMQLLGAISLLICVVSMMAVILEIRLLANVSFAVALIMMAGSLGCLVVEVWISGGALRIQLSDMEGERKKLD